MNSRKFISVAILLFLTMGLLLGGCQKKEEAATMEEQPAAQQPAVSDTMATMPADTTHMTH
jgi:hypothetical protein